jgi:hypothetical protein
MEESNKPTLSDSALAMLYRCGKQYEFRYVENIKVPPGSALIVGISTHDSVAHNMRSKKDTGALLPLEQIKDTASDQVKGLWQQGVKLNKDEVKEGPKKAKAEAIDTAVGLSALHYSELAPKIKPKEVERFFRVELIGYPMDLTGRIDLEEEDDSLRDTKTSARSPSQADVDASDQVTIYSLGKTIVDGATPEQLAKAFSVTQRIVERKLTMDYLVKTKVKKVVSLETKRTEAHLHRIFRLIEQAVVVIEKGAFMPNPNGWWCSKNWCGYWDRCPYFSGRE